MGGAIGVSALGAVLANRFTTLFTERFPKATAIGGGTAAVPDVTTLPAQVRAIIADVYSQATADLFLIGAPTAALAVVAVLFIKEKPLHTLSGHDAPRRSARRAESEIRARLQLRDLDEQALGAAHLQLRAEVRMAGRLGPGQPPAQLVQRYQSAEVELHRALAADGVRRLGDQGDLRSPDLHEDPVAVPAAVDDLAAKMLVEGDGRGHVADVHQRPELEVHTGFNE
jgi:hypothetical protein